VSDLLLPPGARLVHIGPQKTGTTSIQVAMSHSREAWPEHQAYYPEGPYRRRRAGWALGLPGGPVGVEVPMRHWTDLVEEVRTAGDLRVCVSDENFARAESDVAERIVSDLGGDRVHVIAVVRRLDLFLPSQWQERVKSGVSASFDTWLGWVLGDDESKWERWNVWQGHDVGGLLDRWLQYVDADRFTLVIADETDRSQLPRLFETMLGLPDGLLDPQPDRSNVGLAWSELELLRALRDVYDRNGWGRQDRIDVLPKIVAALRARPERALGPRSAPLPPWALERVRELSEQRVTRIENASVRVIGDPQSLLVPADASATDEVSADDLSLPIGLAAAAVEGAIRAERARRGTAPRTSTTLSGRELLQLAARRAAARFRGR
jgi:hypothetical protein